MYQFNYIYVDDDLEMILENIAEKINLNKKINKKIDNRIVFYDYWGLETRGLTSQYIKALIDLGFKILYVTPCTNVFEKNSFLMKLNKENKLEILFINESRNLFTQEIRKAVETITEFSPVYSFIHTTPYDVIGVVIFLKLKGVVTRYLINLTDHAFWIGKSCADYFIEFRSYGYNISNKYRNIDKDKLIILPYYPYDVNAKFEGLPLRLEEKKYVLSGGALYKIYGSNIYTNLVNYILEKYADMYVVFIGYGDVKPLKYRIKKEYWNKRFFFLNERKDFNEIIKRCYFYLGTYPVSGGLMTQYAIKNKKIVLSYNDKNLPCNDLEGFFIDDTKEKNKITFCNYNELLAAIDEIIKDPCLLKKREKKVDYSIISENEFKEELKACIKTNNTKFSYMKKNINVNIGAFSSLYLELENKYLKNYYLTFFSKETSMFMKFPFYYLKGLYKNITKKIR